MKKETKTGVINADLLTFKTHLVLTGLRPGARVYEYPNPTDDCVSPDCVAIQKSLKEEHFYSVPKVAVNWE